METLTNTLHDNIAWQFKETEKYFTIALAEIKIWDKHHDHTRITGNVGKSLQRSATTLIIIVKLKERDRWDDEKCENIECQSRATVIKGINSNDKKNITSTRIYVEEYLNAIYIYGYFSLRI